MPISLIIVTYSVTYSEILAVTKLDSSFPINQFLTKGFHEPFRLDMNRNSGELLMYINSSLPVKMLSNFTLPFDIEAVSFQLNLQKKVAIS